MSRVLVAAALFSAAIAAAEEPAVEAHLEEAASAGAALERALEGKRSVDQQDCQQGDCVDKGMGMMGGQGMMGAKSMNVPDVSAETGLPENPDPGEDVLEQQDRATDRSEPQQHHLPDTDPSAP